ncbi:formate dehydrogenase gamma subunit [Salinihabitans flavidus]|uniref:Formate dehydrogenase gamma subunit n=1 Tax=Salinihabitans flavidus TaxID=569882 RepID=A0A1H8PTC3_9RHOB|nr:formate dehydrogenase subunit gamma [Salinihabitans flavidus]SEO45016.1 formate dehydrogenase gamma subunit [Salinihabitans flavidus]
MSRIIQSFLNLVFACLCVLSISVPAIAQGVDGPRATTGGAQTLEDILKRQNDQKIDESFRSEAIGSPAAAADERDQLGVLGGVADSEFWRAFRYGRLDELGDLSVSARGPAAEVVIQDSGMRWLEFREGPLATYGGYLLLGVLAILLLFLLLRGRIRIDGEKAGTTIQRFDAIERFAHWLLAGSFVLLAITGLTLLFGRMAIIPLIGHEAYAPFAIAGKWVHNNVSWAFMLGLVMVTVLWIAHNIPNKHDLKWIAVAGGLFSKGVHPPARKFNAGQKLIFWGVVVLGVSISASGLSLLFPFELPMFAPTFEKLNAFGIPGILGMEPLPETLMPHEEMQLSQIWHTIIAFVFIAMIFGHIYIGSVGMEGAFDAMGSGQVDEQWAKEHHGLWYEEVTDDTAHGADHKPAE